MLLIVLLRHLPSFVPSVTRRFFFKSPIGGVNIAKKLPTFLEKHLKLPEFKAKIAAETHFFRVSLHFY